MSIPEIKIIQDDIFARYDASFIDHFGHDELRYCSDMACRYTLHVMPSVVDTRAIHAFALWLSMFWVIDCVLDTSQGRFGPEDVQHLIDMLAVDEEDERAQAGAARTGAHGSRDPLIVSLLGAVPRLQKEYLTLVRPYRLARPDLWRAQMPFTRGLLEKFIDSNVPSTVNEYRDFRLLAGGSMHVATHVLYAQPDSMAAFDEASWRHFCMASCYINDLASLPRDLRDKIPNLVSVLMHAKGKDVWDATLEAMALADEEIAEIRRSGNQLALAAILGDLVFHQTERRYASGIAMLEALKSGNKARFFDILQRENYFPGDPAKPHSDCAP